MPLAGFPIPVDLSRYACHRKPCLSPDTVLVP